jgi:hypothetical protein
MIFLAHEPGPPTNLVSSLRKGRCRKIDVPDFPANTVRHRDWIRSLIAEANVAHELHHLDIPDPPRGFNVVVHTA